MLSYKNLTDVIAEQAKNLKLMHERKKDEQENLLQALREMQAENTTNDRLGKLYFIIMLSRWQEAAVNKKYCHVLNEVKEMRGELLRSETHNHALQKDNNLCNENLDLKVSQLIKLEAELESVKSTFITQTKFDQLYRDFKRLDEDRTDLELELLKAREKWHVLDDRVIELTVHSETNEKLYESLQHKNSKEISQALIDMSKDFQSMKLTEYKLKREHSDMKEKLEYYTRLLKSTQDSVFSLEKTAADSEAKMLKEREEFRKRDLER